MGQNSKKYEFAAVGELETVFENRLVETSEGMPVGIKTPMELGYNNVGPFKMHTEILQQIRDNFRNMLQTNHGDRVILHDFGANLEGLAFELGSESADTLAIQNIRRTTAKYMPFINLQTFESFNRPPESNSGLALIGVKVVYTVPTINTDPNEIEVIIYSAG